jgi:hypothetical protein
LDSNPVQLTFSSVIEGVAKRRSLRSWSFRTPESYITIKGFTEVNLPTPEQLQSEYDIAVSVAKDARIRADRLADGLTHHPRHGFGASPPGNLTKPPPVTSAIRAPVEANGFSFEDPPARFTVSQRDTDQATRAPIDPSSDDGPDIKRFSYNDGSKLSVPLFRGFTCEDVDKWIEVYVKKCRALNINRAKSFYLHCDEPTYKRIEAEPSFPNLDFPSPPAPVDPWAPIETLIRLMYHVPKDRMAQYAEYNEC